MVTTRPNIEELDRLHGEAASGEWKHDLDEERPEGSITDASGYGIAIVFPYASVKTVMRTGQEFSHDDARAIVAHHNAWPEVSAYIRELEAKIERTATRCRQEIQAHEMAGEDADSLDRLAADIARRVLSDLGETS